MVFHYFFSYMLYNYINIYTVTHLFRTLVQILSSSMGNFSKVTQIVSFLVKRNIRNYGEYLDYKSVSWILYRQPSEAVSISKLKWISVSDIPNWLSPYPLVA